MPLLDHFNPPLYSARHEESFHSQWAGEIANSLNRQLLPEHYFAEIQVHVGSRVEVDVATLHDEGESQVAPEQTGGIAIATRPVRAWSPPEAAMSMPTIYPDSIEVLVYDMESGYTLVAAVEFVSPGNKDRFE